MRFFVTFITIIIFFIVYFIKYSRQKKTIRKGFSDYAFNRLNKSKTRFPGTVKRFLLMFGILLLIQSIFLPLPDAEKKISKNKNTSSNKILFLLDVSLSMMTKDVGHSRLEMAKIAIDDIIRKNSDTLFALVPFAGTAFIQCPFTYDIDIISQFLDILNKYTIKRGGSNLGSGFKQAIRLFEKSKDEKNNKYLVVLTDGADFSGEINPYYEKIKNMGIETFILGIGGNKPSPIMLYEATRFKEAIFKKDRNNKTVLTKLDKKKLKQVARNLNGKFVLSTNEINKELENRYNKQRGIRKDSKAEIEIDKFFYLFVVLPLILLILGELITTRTRGKLKWVGRFEK
jgi:Ca-activated chloride channel homolog